jgi:hypothetical protein
MVSLPYNEETVRSVRWAGGPHNFGCPIQSRPVRLSGVGTPLARLAFPGFAYHSIGSPPALPIDPEDLSGFDERGIRLRSGWQGVTFPLTPHISEYER